MRSDDLKVELGLCKRVCTEDFNELLTMVDKKLGLLQPSVMLIKAGIDPSVLGILSGMRDYSNFLREILELTTAEVEAAEAQEKQEKENSQ
jgi:acetoin utilization deacetylase AcuC-like enzyme